MITLRASHKLVRFLWATPLLIVAMVIISLGEECPPCFYNQTPPNTTGNGTASDGRPILTVKIDSSWNVDNSGNPQSGTNTNIWNGVTGCTGCVPHNGAAGTWNEATGTGGLPANFNIQINQNTQTPNITIVRDDSIPGCGQMTMSPPGGPYTMRLRTSIASQDLWAIVGAIAHEIGHSIGLENLTNYTSCGLSSIMSPAAPGCASHGSTVTQRDVNQSRKAMDSAARITCESQLNRETLDIDTHEEEPTPTPSPECIIQQCEAGCAWSCSFGTCVGSGCDSPIIIDVLGNGFDLTDFQTGVMFDIDLDGSKEQLSWTKGQSDDAFLVLDRNNNGMIDNGGELFGNYTPQPRPVGEVSKNGFLALAEYDKPMQGGNQDGVINKSDSIFASLRLWHDANHNGISESNEVQTLEHFNLATLHLDYKESKRVDANGNRFRYRAKVKDLKGAEVSRWAWDVFLVAGP